VDTSCIFFILGPRLNHIWVNHCVDCKTVDAIFYLQLIFRLFNERVNIIIGIFLLSLSYFALSIDSINSRLVSFFLFFHLLNSYVDIRVEKLTYQNT